ncbi:MAG: TRAP transporter small permease subunit [Xanthobacter sp.]
MEHKAPEPLASDVVSKGVAWLGKPFSLIFIFTTAIAVLEVIMRYVFDSPTIWVHETTTALTALCFAFGGAYCLAIDKHIRVVLIYDHVGPAAKRWMDVGISAVCTCVCALMSYASFGMVYKALFTPWGALRLETSGSAWNPPFPAMVKTFLFLILIVMTLQFLGQLIGHLRRKPDADAHHGQTNAGVYEDA